MIHIPHLSANVFSWVMVGSASGVVATFLFITPEAIVSFGTVGMLFATPVAVIVSTVMARRDAARAANRAQVVADQLTVANAHVAKIAVDQGKKLDQIHTLVNSNLTAAMESELGAHRAGLILMQEIVDLKRLSGKSPSAESLEAIKLTTAKIDELSRTLGDRVRQTKIAEEGK